MSSDKDIFKLLFPFRSNDVSKAAEFRVAGNSARVQSFEKANHVMPFVRNVKGLCSRIP